MYKRTQHLARTCCRRTRAHAMALNAHAMALNAHAMALNAHAMALNGIAPIAFPASSLLETEGVPAAPFAPSCRWSLQMG